MSSSASSTSSSSSSELPKLAVEFPSDHPVSRRQAQLQAQQADPSVASAPNKDSNEAFQAFLLQRHSQQLTVPGSPQEQRRRNSINPQSRRNSILAIPPTNPDGHLAPNHVPESGHDIEVDSAELAKELEEIDTIG